MFVNHPAAPGKGSFPALPPNFSKTEVLPMKYSFYPSGVCSQEMVVELDERGVIQDLKVIGGCNGNLTGISALVRGQDARKVIQLLKGTRCGPRPTSCPDQLAKALKGLQEK